MASALGGALAAVAVMSATGPSNTEVQLVGNGGPGSGTVVGPRGTVHSWQVVRPGGQAIHVYGPSGGAWRITRSPGGGWTTLPAGPGATRMCVGGPAGPGGIVSWMPAGPGGAVSWMPAGPGVRPGARGPVRVYVRPGGGKTVVGPKGAKLQAVPFRGRFQVVPGQIVLGPRGREIMIGPGAAIMTGPKGRKIVIGPGGPFSVLAPSCQVHARAVPSGR